MYSFNDPEMKLDLIAIDQVMLFEQTAQVEVLCTGATCFGYGAIDPRTLFDLALRPYLYGHAINEMTFFHLIPPLNYD
jgi:hypothetical protein